MKILVLGGTLFLGRAAVGVALTRGHEVVLFNRGRTRPDLFADVEKLRGDRDGGLEPLRGREFDAVLDTSGYVPRVVRESASRLADAAGLYVFVSSLSVYTDEVTPGQDETAPVVVLPDPETERVTSETYGGLKALCERAAEEEMPGRVLSVRPGLICGPRDPTDRFTWWPVRVARGGDVLAPEPREMPVELTDVRDLAGFLVRAMEAGVTGTLDVSGPTPPRPSMESLLTCCREVAGSDARFVWANEATLAEQGVAPWTDLPLFVGVGATGFATRDVSRAIAAGMTWRPVADTVRDTLAWARTLPPDRALRAGLSPDREARVVAAIVGAGG